MALSAQHMTRTCARRSSGAAHVNGLRPRKTVQCSALLNQVQLTSSTRSETTVGSHPKGDLAAYFKASPAFFCGLQMPMGGSLRSVDLDNGLFELTVPRIQLFDLWIQPRAEAILRVEQLPCGSSRLAVTATKCKLLGSKHVEEYKLNERFVLDVKINFVSDQPRGPGTPGAIKAKGDIGVKVDLPPPFSFMPHQVLQTTGNTALNTTIGILLNSIVNSMAKDYARWASQQQQQMQPAPVPVGTR